MPTRIHLVRHGEVHNPRKILYGRLPYFRLSVAGRRQARETGRYLAGLPIRSLFSSPMLRARQTAGEILASHPGLKLHISSYLNEVRSAYEGVPGEQVDRKQGDIYSGCGAGYEQPADVFARVAKFLSRARRRFPGGQVAAVTHGDVITFSVLWAKGWPLLPRNKSRLTAAGYPAPYPAHASVTTLTFHTADRDEYPTVDYIRPW